MDHPVSTGSGHWTGCKGKRDREDTILAGPSPLDLIARGSAIQGFLWPSKLEISREDTHLDNGCERLKKESLFSELETEMDWNLNLWLCVLCLSLIPVAEQVSVAQGHKGEGEQCPRRVIVPPVHTDFSFMTLIYCVWSVE
jgi:hypothetical protein